ncbi:cytochrome c oxidase assembly protein [Ramlibacter sp. AW1]|uniref:Cytochrome c oxidase assembly protein n=1 Tax=Ramlibacter aurantiacus TaxID=2801330 RepID=A0A936ZTG6_9BURK|nr:cytochrome c oxidase assembly protein [Ramlibacter aurantiacus]MBL0423406.1 cytochrome c oxidase assembly protein [Ramlibacter aurantiacus]
MAITSPCGPCRLPKTAGGLLSLAFPVTASAHVVPGLDGHTLWNAWSTQPWLWLLWGLPGLLVLAGIARLWLQARAGAGVSGVQAGCFLAGWLALGLSILSPLDALGEELFWVHMVQHEVVMLVAAPLLVISRPLGALVWGLPAAWRPGSAQLARVLGLSWSMRVLTRPMAAWWVHAVVLWVWHAPPLFQAAVRHPWVHDLQHSSFFIGALVFWWALLQGHGGRVRQGMAVLYLFTTVLHTSALGALLTFSSRVWYPVYDATAPRWGFTALEDQQLGGLIMWVPGGMVFMVAALVLFAAWLQGPARPGPALR